MTDFKKIYCAYHQKEFITNFCLERNCVLPLCPQCICSHNDIHNQNHTQATYTSIEKVLSSSYKSMISLIKSFDSEQKRLNQIFPRINQMPTILLQKLKLAKNMAIHEIDLAFDKLQKQMLIMLAQKQNIITGPNFIYIDETFKIIDDSINHLNKRISSLNNQKCLSSVIKFLQKQHQQCSTLKIKVTQRINSFQYLEPCVTINEQILQHIDSILKRFITLSFSEMKSNLQIISEIQSENESSLFPTSCELLQPFTKMKNQCGKLQEIRNKKIQQIIIKKEKNQHNYDDQLDNISKKIANIRKSYKDMGSWINKI